MRYRVVKGGHWPLYVLDTVTGEREGISIRLAELLDPSKIEPLRPRVKLYEDPIPLIESIKRANEVSREKWKRHSWRGGPRERQSEMPLSSKSPGKRRKKR